MQINRSNSLGQTTCCWASDTQFPQAKSSLIPGTECSFAAVGIYMHIFHFGFIQKESSSRPCAAANQSSVRNDGWLYSSDPDHDTNTEAPFDPLEFLASKGCQDNHPAQWNADRLQQAVALQVSLVCLANVACSWIWLNISKAEHDAVSAFWLHHRSASNHGSCCPAYQRFLRHECW